MKLLLHLARWIATLFRRPFMVVVLPLGDDVTRFEVLFNRRAIDQVRVELNKGREKPLPPMNDEEMALIFMDTFDPRDTSKIVYERLGLAYMSARFVYETDRDPAFEVVQNRHAVYDIDRRYHIFGREDYDVTMEDSVKALTFVADMAASAVPNYAQERVPMGEIPDEVFMETLNDLGGRVPSMREAPVRDIADLAEAKPAGTHE